MDQTRTCSVLVVEDERMLRQMLLEILQKAGFAELYGAAD